MKKKEQKNKQNSLKSKKQEEGIPYKYRVQMTTICVTYF